MYDQQTGQWTVFGQGENRFYSELHYYSGIIPREVATIGESRDGRIWFSASWTGIVWTERPTLVSSFDGKRWEEWKIEVKPDATLWMGIFPGRDGALWFWKGDEVFRNDGRGWQKALRLSEAIRDQNLATSFTRGGTAGAADRDATRHRIFASIQDREGHLWLATASGVLRFDERNHELRKYPQIGVPIANAMYEDRNGRIWLAEGDNVLVYDKANNAIARYRLSDYISRTGESDEDSGLPLMVLGIYQDRRRQMLFALSTGLLSFSETDAKWELFDLESIGLPLGVEHIMEDKSGRVWIATYSGIAILDK
jgi:hypothetical protein